MRLDAGSAGALGLFVVGMLGLGAAPAGAWTIDAGDGNDTLANGSQLASVSLTGGTAAFAKARAAQAEDDAPDLTCASYESASGTSGATTIVACDQEALERYLSTGVQDPQASPRLNTNDPDVKIAPGAVSTAEAPPGTDPATISITAGGSGKLHLFLATTAGELHFPAFSAPRGVPLTVSAPAGGPWVVRDNRGNVLVSGQPVSRAAPLKPVRRLAAKRSHGLVRVSFTADEPAGTRFTIDLGRSARGGGHAKRVIGRRRDGRYVVHLRAWAGDRYARVRVTGRGAGVPARSVRIRPRL